MSPAPLAAADVADQLHALRADLITELDALSDAQWEWTPDDAHWSPALIAEHIAVVERSMARLFGERFETLEAVNFTDEQRAKRDHVIAMGVPDRTRKIEAPETARPKRRFATRAECMAAMLAARDQMTEVVRERGDALRGRIVPHPAFGNIDGVQWGLVCALHGARHLAQVNELRTLPGFPAA
jgi:hypothetical protein